MSEPTPNAPRVSMFKGAASGRAANRPPVEKVPIPGLVLGAYAALVVTAVGLLVAGISAKTASFAALKKYEIWVNANAKNPIKHYAKHPAQIAHDVAQYRSGSLLESLLIGIVVLLIGAMTLRTRTASPARWGVIVILVITQVPFYVIAHPHFQPSAIRGANLVAGMAAIAVIVLMFLPQSTAYFRACREATLPPERRGQQRPSLFGPRPPRGAAPTRGGRPAAGGTTGTSSAEQRSDNPSAGKSRAKVRADAESVAKGAELARSRAKAASKSRRTEN